jgi:hypothetical protein
MVAARLNGLLIEVGRVVERRGGTAAVDLPVAAAPARLAEVAAFAGAPLPPSLLALWSMHDGIAIRVYGRDEAPGITTHQLVVRSTASAITASRELRDFFAGVRESGAGPDGDCALVQVTFYEDFVGKPPAPLAHSIGEFIERSLRFMIDTEGGFEYWADPDTDW